MTMGPHIGLFNIPGIRNLICFFVMTTFSSRFSMISTGLMSLFPFCFVWERPCVGMVLKKNPNRVCYGSDWFRRWAVDGFIFFDLDVSVGV